MSFRLAMAAAVALVVGTAIMFGLPDPQPDLTENVFVDKLPNRVELHAHEDLRMVEFYPDDITPRYAFAEHKDGSTTEYWYRPDGTHSEAISRYPEKDGVSQIKRHATMAADGITYAVDIEYREDGTRIKETRLVDNDNSRKRYFHANGNAVEKELLFALREGSWALTSETHFTVAGIPTFERLIMEDGATTTSRFRDNGTRLASETLNNYKTIYNATWFHEDGTTPRWTVKQTNQGTESERFAEDGRLVEKRSWWGDIGESGGVWYEFFDENGTARLRKWWFFKPEHGGYVHWSTTVMDAAGEDLRKIYWHDDGQTVESDTVTHADGPNAGGTTRKDYREEDGTLEKIRVTDADNKVIFEHEFTLEHDRTVLSDTIVHADGPNTGGTTRMDYGENGALERVIITDADNNVIFEHQFTAERGLLPEIEERLTVFDDHELPPQIVKYNPPRGPH